MKIDNNLKPLNSKSSSVSESPETENTFKKDDRLKNLVGSHSPVSDSGSIGSYLQDARVKSELSLSQVALTTKIHIHYLEAIERDDFSNAPPFIFVQAYIKRLCDLYSLDTEETLKMLKRYDSKDQLVTQPIAQGVKSTGQFNKDDQKKIKFYSRVFGITAGVLILVIIVVILSITLGDSSSIENDKVFSQKEKQELRLNMEKLTAPQFISMSELKEPHS